ncbi:MAG: PhzF family phenazine biosynthesis protein [Cyclobacteriaceae bacterium]
MIKIKYHTLDVFTSNPFGGNQLAVVPDATNVPNHLLQKIANEFNLSETTFVYPATRDDCDFKVRIFTPGQELPMAGHPTLGTAYILALNQDIGSKSKLKLVLEEGVGPIPVEIEIENELPGLITMSQPVPKISEPFDHRKAIAELLSLNESDLIENLPVQVLDCGVPYMIIPVKSLKAVESIKYRLDIWDELRSKYQIPFSLAYTLETVHAENQVHCRMFAPEAGVLEDPATGSAHGPLGSYLAIHQVLGEGDIKFKSEQGYELARPSELIVEIKKSGGTITKVLVGGRCVKMGEGELSLN